MTFLSPERLWLLVGVAALAAAYVVVQRRRRLHVARFTNPVHLDALAPSRPGWRRHVVAALLLAGVATLLVGTARPARAERVPREEAVVMLAIDISASMTATDIAPSRLDAAVGAATQFVEDVPDSFEIGVVAFDERARVLATPTTDHAAVVDAIQALQPGTGTAAGEGLFASLDALSGVDEADGDLPTTVVLLSDGATTAGRPVDDAATAAAEAEVPVTTIAFGTEDGRVVVEGQIVPVPADTEAMAAVADATGGSFFEAGSAGELRSVYDVIQGRVGYATEQREVVQGFLGAGVSVLTAAFGLSFSLSARVL